VVSTKHHISIDQHYLVPWVLAADRNEILVARDQALTLRVPGAYPKKFKNRETLVSPIGFRACHVAPERVAAAIDEVAAQAALAARQ
jgi:hypothetical protein